MHITLREDYPLKGDITKFETYMFMTTKKFIEEHSEFPHEKFYVCHGADNEQYSLDDLVSRKDAQHNFNVYMTQHLGHFPKAEELGCFITYLEADGPKEDDDSYYFFTYEYLASMVMAFCEVGNRVVGFIPHFHQGNNCPHIHFLYQRGKDESNFLQSCLSAMMDNQEKRSELLITNKQR